MEETYLANMEAENQLVHPLRDWIKLIKNLPDYILETEHGVRIPFGKKNGVGLMMYAIRAKYIAIAGWLTRYLLDDEGILAELGTTNKKHYKPVAEIAVARYKLAQELQIYLSEFVDFQVTEDNPLNPGRWMTLCIHQDCKYDLEKSGLLGQPATEGKVAAWERMKENLNLLEEVPGSSSIEIKFCTTSPKEPDPIKFLEGCSAWVAERNLEFRGNYHNAYIKTLRHCYRSIRNDKFFRVAVLDEESNITTMAKGKGKGKSKKKGFAREL